MSEADELRAVGIRDAVTAMLQGMFAGARAVDSASIGAQAFPARSAYPQRYAVRGMRAELNFEARLDQTLRFLWLKKESTRPSAQVRVIMGLEPTLNPAVRMPHARDPLIVVPEFLAAAGSTEKLELRLSDGRRLRVAHDATGGIDFDGGPGVTFRLTGDGATPVDRGELFLNPPGQWPINDIVEVLESVAQWKRGNVPVRKMRLALSPAAAADPGSVPDPHVAWLLASILDGCGHVAAVIESASGAADADHSVRISELSASVRVYRENLGELAPSEEKRRPRAVQRLDLLVSPAAISEDGTTLLTFDLPDVLVAGELHDRMLGALRDAREDIHDALGRRTLDQEQVSALLEMSRRPGVGVLVRITHDDTDLVLLRDGTGKGGAGLLLEVKFRLSKTDGTPAVERIEHVRLVAHARDGRWQGSQRGDLVAPYYFARFLRTFHALQSCLAADPQQAAGKTVQ